MKIDDRVYHVAKPESPPPPASPPVNSKIEVGPIVDKVPNVLLSPVPPWWNVSQASTAPSKDSNQFERRVLEVVGLDPRAVFVGQELDGWTVESLTRVADGLSVTLRRLPAAAKE